MPTHTYYKWSGQKWVHIGSGLWAWHEYDRCRSNRICTAVVNHCRTKA